jgi:hypothetical protein
MSLMSDTLQINDNSGGAGSGADAVYVEHNPKRGIQLPARVVVHLLVCFRQTFSSRKSGFNRKHAHTQIHNGK